MSGENRRGGLAAESKALDLYLDSLYQDAQDDGAGAPVISLVPEISRHEEEQVGPQPSHGREESIQQEPGEEELRLLLFRLCGLGMAVAASEIESTVPWPGELAPAPGKRPLCLGVMEEGTASVPVMDLAGLVIPERLRDRRPVVGPSHVLVASGGLGLACHGVEGVVGVPRGAVNWRTERASRRWLAGTIAEHGSALLDMAALRVLLRGESPGGIV
ncbi:MAG TPA: hypothetical protein ENJ43_04855 [Gammaproteobacteria bacterium]|nr:hypothetical protein [Gammaproteobacteria bacterium]